MRKLKILEVTTYTAGGCGVGARVLHEAELLAQRGHDVAIFSTDHVKGAPREKALAEEHRGRVVIKRFPATKLGGESFTSWNFEAAALAFKPEVIIVHAYRHLHTMQALRIARHLNVPCLLVTHAPFNTGQESRSLLAKAAIAFYDAFTGRQKLRRFTKVIAITHWELPFLKKLGVPSSNIVYLPNGIPSLFFTQKPAREDTKKILYFGRLAPVKDLETLMRALALIRNHTVSLELVGPAEAAYLSRLKSLMHSLRLESRVSFTPAIYETKKKIAKLDSTRVFVLASKREGMPQSLIEALARACLVVASDNLGNKDLIQHKKNGFLFPVGNPSALAAQLDAVFALPPQQAHKMQTAARASVLQFAWPLIIRKLEGLLREVVQEKH